MIGNERVCISNGEEIIARAEYIVHSVGRRRHEEGAIHYGRPEEVTH